MGRSAAASRMIDKRRAGRNEESDIGQASHTPVRTFPAQPTAAGTNARASGTSAVASRGATHPGIERGAPGLGPTSKPIDDAKFSEMLLQGVRAAVGQRSSHLSKDVAAFSKIKW